MTQGQHSFRKSSFSAHGVFASLYLVLIQEIGGIEVFGVALGMVLSGYLAGLFGVDVVIYLSVVATLLSTIVIV